MGFQAQIEEALRALDDAGLRRHPPRISGTQGPTVQIDGRRVLCFCSNNYLGLADHPDLVQALSKGAEREGASASASRLITGTMDAHEEAEQRFAEFVGAEASVLFSTGYAANVGTIPALVGPGDLVFSDALNHASLIDGCRLSRAKVLIYRHRDIDHLRGLLREHRAEGRRALIVSDSLFSMDGVLAPIRDLHDLAQDFDAGLMLDEAHALGVLGPEGRGAAFAENLQPDLIVGTLGKSFGTAGAFVACSRTTAGLLRNRARSFVYSTAPPPAVIRAALAALPLVRAADDARQRLREHGTRVRNALRALDLPVPDGNGPILPVPLGANDRAMRWSHALFEEGVFVQGIRPPTVPVGTARLRLTLMATHREEHIETALAAFARVAGMSDT